MRGKRILVTGSTRGIGRAAATLLLEQGAEVIVHGRRADEVQAAVAALGAISPAVSGAAGDLASRAAVAAIAAQAGEIDGLVNCAGIYEEQALADVDAQSFARSVEVNLTAPFLLSRLLLEGLRRRRGVIVNVASDAGVLGIAGGSTYCASKGGLIGLTKALAVELAPAVRAICICPGPVATDMMEQSVAHADDPAAARAQWNAYTLLQRVARPREIASLIVYGLGDDAGFATGAVWLMDGGVSAGRHV